MDRDSRVLITGSTGFVGSHLVEALHSRVGMLRALVRATSDLTVLDHLRVERVEGDLTDRAALARAVDSVDVVLHLAAATRARSKEAFQRANAEGTAALAEAVTTASPRPRRLVYLSSMAAVGPSNGGGVKPADTPRPLTTYGRSKLEGEEACLAAGAGVQCVVVRAPAVYGPGDRDLLTFFRMAAKGAVPVPAGEPRKLQLIHVADLVRALIAAAEVPQARGIYHVADPQAYEWAEVARLVGRSVGRAPRLVPLPPFVFSMAGRLSEAAANARGQAAVFTREKAVELLAPGWECDTERAETELGFQTKIALPQGLAETAAWYRSQGWL